VPDESAVPHLDALCLGRGMTEPVRRVAVVTGGAGAIGASIAAALSAAGPGPYGSDGPLLSLGKRSKTKCAGGVLPRWM
jgi:hypothetical protein